MRALTILDDLIQNAGSGFQKSFADEPLLERLRFIVTDPTTDNEVKAKCQALYRQWATTYKGSPGMHNIATLYKQLPVRKRVPNKETSKVLRETERPDDDDDDDDEEPQSPRKASNAGATSQAERRRSNTPFHKPSSSMNFASGLSAKEKEIDKKKEKDKKSKSKAKPFNFEKEKAQINTVITQASIEATGLLNALKHINREAERVSENPNAKRHFDTCKQLRRLTFRYCSLVLDESYLGTLLNANDQLSDALILFEQLDKSFDYDSDSEDYDDPDGESGVASAAHKAKRHSPPARKFAALSLKNDKGPAMPPRPTFNAAFVMTPPDGKGKEKEAEDEPGEEEEDDEDDPFADRNEVSTPNVEKDGMTW